MTARSLPPTPSAASSSATPPSNAECHNTRGAIDLWSHGASARFGGAAGHAGYRDDGAAQVAHVSGSTGTIGGQVQATSEDLSALLRSRVAAETGTSIESALSRAKLTDSQAANLGRFTKKPPSGAGEPVITRGANGSVQFDANVPERVPGSSATYTNVVGSDGATTDYFKTGYAPDGSVVHMKIKFP